MLQALCAVAKKPVRCLRGHGDPVRIKRLANRPIKVLSATLLDKRGYVNLGRGNDSQKGQLIVIEGLDGSGKDRHAFHARKSYSAASSLW